MARIALLFMLVWSGLPKIGAAQSGADVVWVQVEARPTYADALERIEDFAADVQDVTGFQLRGGWFAITLGPYTPDDAAIVLRSYRAQGLIPRDSYIAQSAVYGQQYWPPGDDILGRGRIAAPTVAATEPVQQAPVTQAPVVEAQTPDPETRSEARRSEGLLSAQDRRDLQIALQWAGYYNSTIDGAFGRGTRASMAAWQRANGVEPTGILTTRQRAALLGQYNAILDGLDMQTVRDTDAGIAVKMPRAAVGFDRFDAPFAHYEATGSLQARVLLISQQGSRATLQSLYDIMQTLTIVPLQGPRQISGDRFTLVGQDDKIVSATEVTRVGDEIKGFTLIWPRGDEARRTRVLAEMRASFERLDGVLDPAAGTESQQIDLFSGLQIRTPLRSRSGFFVDDRGTVVTTAEAVQSCARITLDDTLEARLNTIDRARGVAVLKPSQDTAPPAFARFSPVQPLVQSEIAVAGFPFEGQLDAPSMTFGTLAESKGLRGEDDLSRLELETLPGDVGGPVMDAGGNVLGMLLPPQEGARQLPRDVQFALKGEVIAQVLGQAGLRPRQGAGGGTLDPIEITDRGVGMTVLVHCWD